MTTIMPEGDEIRKAVKWICDERGEDHGRIKELIDKASVEFDLSPVETDFLYRFFSDNQAPKCGVMGE